MEDRKRVTEYLSGRGVDAVLSSPYRRAVDTGADFAQSCGFEIELIDDFRERELPGWLEDYPAFVIQSASLLIPACPAQILFRRWNRSNLNRWRFYALMGILTTSGA